MTTILGIDAAWTAAQPSGVALIQRHYGRWRCLAAAPSYPSFELLARAVACDWSQGGEAGQADVGRLIAAAEHLAGESLGVAAVDMPVSTADITGRRAADREVSRRFGSRGCSTHSPSPLRPGQLGAALAQQFMVAGFDMATTATAPGTPRRLVEVYPHPALLALLGRDMRVPYKVSKSCSYWPGARIEVRIARLLAEFEAILDGPGGPHRRDKRAAPAAAGRRNLEFAEALRGCDRRPGVLLGWLPVPRWPGCCPG